MVDISVKDKWTCKGVTFIQSEIEAKGSSAPTQDDILEKLKNLESDQGPIDGIRRSRELCLYNCKAC
jgi:hypothetical protein